MLPSLKLTASLPLENHGKGSDELSVWVSAFFSMAKMFFSVGGTLPETNIAMGNPQF